VKILPALSLHMDGDRLLYSLPPNLSCRQQDASYNWVRQEDVFMRAMGGPQRSGNPF